MATARRASAPARRHELELAPAGRETLTRRRPRLDGIRGTSGPSSSVQRPPTSRAARSVVSPAASRSVRCGSSAAVATGIGDCDRSTSAASGACRSSATSRRRRATGSTSTPVGPAAPRAEAGAAVLELPAIVEVEGRGAKAVATKDGPVVDEGAVAVTVQRAPAAGHPAEDLVRLDSPAFPAQDLQPRRPGRSASAADVFRRLLLWAPRFSL
jgi:hypothetical protein